MKKTEWLKSICSLPGKAGLAVLGVFLVSSGLARATSISSLDTGAGFFFTDDLPPNAITQQDPNWTVTLLSGGPAPGPNPTPQGDPAYVVPNSIPGFAGGIMHVIPQWTANDATSTWITYTTPTQLGYDDSNEYIEYETQFIAGSSGVFGINFLSDDTAHLFVNDTDVGNNAAFSLPEGTWLTSPVLVSATAGQTYTIDLRVENIPQNSPVHDLLNPTGARVQFTGDVLVADSGSPGFTGDVTVSDNSSPLLLLAIGFGTVVSLCSFGSGWSRLAQHLLARGKSA